MEKAVASVLCILTSFYSYDLALGVLTMIISYRLGLWLFALYKRKQLAKQKEKLILNHLVKENITLKALDTQTNKKAQWISSTMFFLYSIKYAIVF